MKHWHVFERYYPPLDRWVCACGASMDRKGQLFDGDKGSLFLAAVTNPDDRVTSGRELLSC